MELPGEEFTARSIAERVFNVLFKATVNQMLMGLQKLEFLWQKVHNFFRGFALRAGKAWVELSQAGEPGWHLSFLFL